MSTRVASPVRATLERPLPTALHPRRAEVVFIAGTCADERGPLDAVEILVDGHPEPVSAFGMPNARGERTRFWATVPVPGGAAGAVVTIGLRATTPGREPGEAELARIPIAQSPPAPDPAGRPASGDAIAVCMATFEPDPALFQAQVNSLRAQTDVSWICYVSDDCSAPDRFAQLDAELSGDGRFVVSRSPERLGFYRNFERALGMVPAGVELIALCDQDDRWDPDKLATLRASLGDAVLVYSDLRLVEADGRVLRDTLWRGRSNNHTDLAAMLVANTITGAATLFRRTLLDTLMPFPDTPGFQFHDHWLAVTALSVGPVAYVQRPLYDYVQHRGAVFGHVTHGEPSPASARRAARALGAARTAVVRWRAAYFYGYLARQVQAETLLARCGGGLHPDKRRTLERFVAAERSAGALLWLAARSGRALLGHTETLGSELELVRGLLWKRLATWAARRQLPRGVVLSADMPALTDYTQKRLRRWRASIGAR